MSRKSLPSLTAVLLVVVWLLGSYVLTYRTEVGRTVYCAGRIDALEIPALSPCR